jgi:hypothetical protein
MDWKDKIGKSAYRIKNNKISKELIYEGRETIRLNTGSNMHGRLLDPRIEYMFNGDKDWVKEDDIFFTKDELLKSMD